MRGVGFRGLQGKEVWLRLSSERAVERPKTPAPIMRIGSGSGSI